MSAGNAAACIGLANTNKQLRIGAYVQDVGVTGGTVAGPEADGEYAGINGRTYYESNVLGEAVGFTAASNSGAAAGKLAQWVTNTGALAAGTTRVNIAAGVVTADNATGTHDLFITVPAAGLAANKFFWVFER